MGVDPAVDREIVRVAGIQRGHVTARQLSAAGLTAEAIK
jgi:hypothetical protein